MPTTECTVDHISSPQITRGLNDKHRVRALISPGDWAATDPFLLLMEDWFPVGVFDRHPHRGFETVTYVLDGAIEHYDNHGHKGFIGPGDAQWLTAGRGIIHNEQPSGGEEAHILQLWINLPRNQKLVRPSHQELKGSKVPLRREPGVEVRVFAGHSASLRSPTHTYSPVTMLEITLAPGTTLIQEVDADFNAFLVIVTGDGTGGPDSLPLSEGQIVWLSKCGQDSTLALTSGRDGMRAMFFAGLPLNEEVAARGPFVMNTHSELMESFAQYQREGNEFGMCEDTKPAT